MQSFDYDAAEQQILARRTAAASGDSTLSPPAQPEIYMARGFGNLVHVLSRPGESDRDESLCCDAASVARMLMRKFGMVEPVGDDYDLWTSIVDTELFAIQEFPKRFWVRIFKASALVSERVRGGSVSTLIFGSDASLVLFLLD